MFLVNGSCFKFLLSNSNFSVIQVFTDYFVIFPLVSTVIYFLFRIFICFWMFQ